MGARAFLMDHVANVTGGREGRKRRRRERERDREEGHPSGYARGGEEEES